MSNYSIFPKKILDVLVTDFREKKSENGEKKLEKSDGLKEDQGGKKLDSKLIKIYRYRARKKVKAAIKDITWYAKTQPESQIKQVFQTKDVVDMVSAICGINSKFLEKKEWENDFVHDQRVLELVDGLVNVINRCYNLIINSSKMQGIKQVESIDQSLLNIRNIVIREKMRLLSQIFIPNSSPL